MSILKMKQQFVFDKEVLPHFRIYGDIKDGQLTVCLYYDGVRSTGWMRLQRKDIEALLPVFKELLEVS